MPKSLGDDVVLARVEIAAVCVVSVLLNSCASLNYIHDPQFWVMNREQVPAFLKSIRCELITFYVANRQRQKLFDDTRKIDRDFAVDHYSYFPVSPQLLGGVYLDLKLVDTLGIPASGTTIDRRHIIDPTHSKTWHFGPSLTDQNTYDLIWSFVIEQSAKLYLAGGKPDPFQCYTTIPLVTSGPRSAKSVALARDLDGLARGEYTQLEQFTRMLVNGTTPLAAWLQDNSSRMWTSFAAKSQPAEMAERLIPAQMSYTFTVQATAGLDVKWFTLTPKWNPLALDVSGSIQQTSQLQFTINGPDAPLAAGAKSGSSAAGPPKTPPPFAGTFIRPLEGSHGYLLYPLPLIPPQPSQ